MTTPSQPDQTRQDRLVFYPVAVVGAVFCITVLASTVSLFSDPDHPLSRWMQKYGTRALVLETILLIATALLAMTIDRFKTLKQQQLRRSPALRSPAEQPAEVPHVD
ncbi:hypothetical protein [Planctomicrobium sp. SH664]|uniref:hypothetical protein n=1 Tax=Planctomicrobium sp. SH664 TaxID=3448125 RepID=UPI003F5B333B